MHLIAFNGFKGSGKNTAAQILASLYGDGEGVVYQIGFADKVKIAGARALGYLDESPQECIKLMDDAKEKWIINILRNLGPLAEDWMSQTVNAHYVHGLSGRQYLQNIGTEMRKLFGEDFWVDQVLPQPCRDPKLNFSQQGAVDALALRRLYPEVDCVAITDLRFENEAQRVLDLGGVVWRVNRPGYESDGHDSEQPLPDWLVTHEIDNSDGLLHLEDEVEGALNSL